MAITQRWTVIGIFEDQGAASQAIDALRNAGMSDEQIGFAVRDEGVTEKGIPTSEATTVSGEGTGVVTGGVVGGILGAADALLIPILGPSVASTIPTAGLPLAEEAVDRIQHKGTVSGPEEAEAVDNDVTRGDTSVEEDPDPSKTRADVGEGAIAGGIVGGVLGAAVALLLPVIGPIFAGGILVTALGGAALGAVTGGFLGAFVRMGIPEEHARHYESELHTGRTIVTVKTDDRQQEALDILYRNGASYANAHDRE